MQVPLQITFRNVNHSDAVEDRVREKVTKLEQYCDEMTSCRVLIEKPHKHNQQGQLYHVRVDIAVPGKEIVVKHDANDKQQHEDVYVALRDAFEAARRQVKEYVQRTRKQTKNHDGEEE